MIPGELTGDEYAAFYEPYIASLEEVELSVLLDESKRSFNKLIEVIPENKLNFRYAPKKWSLAEVLLHIIDAERIFQYCALRFSRGDKTNLPGFDENLYVPNSRAHNRTKEELLYEFNLVRDNTLMLFNKMNEEDLLFLGNANGYSTSTRAIGFIICGHQVHHQKIIRERYLI